jgi:hypothetical protein
MRRISVCVLTLLLSAWAHGPAREPRTESGVVVIAEIGAPVADVWVAFITKEGSEDSMAPMASDGC